MAITKLSTRLRVRDKTSLGTCTTNRLSSSLITVQDRRMPDISVSSMAATTAVATMAGTRITTVRMVPHGISTTRKTDPTRGTLNTRRRRVLAHLGNGTAMTASPMSRFPLQRSRIGWRRGLISRTRGKSPSSPYRPLRGKRPTQSPSLGRIVATSQFRPGRGAISRKRRLWRVTFVEAGNLSESRFELRPGSEVTDARSLILTDVTLSDRLAGIVPNDL